MKIKKLAAVISALIIWGCDDDTSSLGFNIIPGADSISIKTVSYTASSRSILANDSILARTDMVYLGRYTDAETNTVFSSDFIAQFNCVEDYGFPDQGVVGDSATSMEICLYYNKYFGDSLNTMKLEVYPLTTTLSEEIPYYTNLDPADFYDSRQSAYVEKTYTAFDNTWSDSLLSAGGFTPNVKIPLPRKLGTEFIQKYYETDDDGNHIGKQYYANSEAFINNICKGFYFKSSQGDGTVLYIILARINVYFDYYANSSTGTADSLVTGVAQFSGTQEVLQVNRFNNGKLDNLVKNDTCTYLKTPAGIFTEVELPINEITANDDTLNSVKITFTRYNDLSTASSYYYGVPQTLLLLRKQEMNTFFENNQTIDNISSFYTTFNSSYNQYEFSNIARLVTLCAQERKNGLSADPDWEADHPEWNKVVLIPASTTKDSNGNIVGFAHDLTMNSVRLIGGKDKIGIRVITSHFNE